MKKQIEVFDYANDILKAVKTGVLLTTKADDKVNTMTISWGTLGIEWGKTIFTVFVRENRFTKSQLDKAGTKSGHDMDKIKEIGLTLEESDKISVPGIKELPLTLECKVLYQQEQDRNAIPSNIVESCYPADVDSSFHGANKDYHTAYYGEIVNAYIIQD